MGERETPVRDCVARMKNFLEKIGAKARFPVAFVVGLCYNEPTIHGGECPRRKTAEVRRACDGFQ